MGLIDDPTSTSYSISKYWQLIETPTVSATFNNFKFQFFITNTDQVDPRQPFMNLNQFIDELKQDAGQHFIQLFNPEPNP
jgi:hypothetical protein